MRRASPASPAGGASLKDDEGFSTTVPPVGDAAGVVADRVLMIGRAQPTDGEDAGEEAEIHRMQATCSGRPLQVQSGDSQLLLPPHIDDGQIWKSLDGPVVEEKMPKVELEIDLDAFRIERLKGRHSRERSIRLHLPPLTELALAHCS